MLLWNGVLASIWQFETVILYKLTMSEYNCPIDDCEFVTDNTRGMSCHVTAHDEDIQYPTDEMLLTAIKELSEELGRVPTTREMNSLGEFSRTKYHNRFGSWSSALRKVDMEPIGNRSGEKSPNWNGGETKFYKTKSGRAWRQAVFERDEYTCQDCNDDSGGNLNAHHIKRREDYPELELMVWNGVTLCEICHTERHKGEKCYPMMRAKVLNSDSPNSKS